MQSNLLYMLKCWFYWTDCFASCCCSRVCGISTLQRANFHWLWSGSQGDWGRHWTSMSKQGHFKCSYQSACLLSTW